MSGSTPSPTAAAAAVAKQLGRGRETVRRWVVQAQVDGGVRGDSYRGAGGDPSVEGGECPAARTITDAMVVEVIRSLAWTIDPYGRRRLAPEGLYGRRKMTALVRRTLPAASPGSVDRGMRLLGLSGVLRAKGVRTTIQAKDGKRAGDLLNRDFTAPAPNRVWVTDFTYVRSWVGWVYVAFILDVFSQRIVAWHAATTKETELVMTPLRMALWARDREGHRVGAGQLIHHSDAGGLSEDLV